MKLKTNLKILVKSIHEGVQYNCEPCDNKETRKIESWSLLGNLNIHVKSIHEGVKYNCEPCDNNETRKKRKIESWSL